MRRKWIWLLAGWLMIAGLVSCGRAATPLSVEATPTASLKKPTGEAPVPTPTVTQSPQEEIVTASPTIPVPSDPTLQKLVIQTTEDLAHRFSIAVGEIELVKADAVEWPDAGLGCPQPGMVYAQVITPGYRMVLKARGQTYEYHTDTGRLVVLCGADGLSIDPVPLMPVAPHDIPGKTWRPAD